MPPFSLVIITYNEERNIARCIESVGDLADEVVVVDSFSTDKTEEICKQYNVKFLQHPFEGHIQQKNYAITKAKHSHVLSLDADEALSDELRNSIRKVKQDWKCDGYYFNRLTNYCGKWIKYSGWYPDRKLRLFDSKKGRWTGLNPHDRYELDKESILGYLKGDLLHYCFNNLKQHVDQTNKFSEEGARALFDKGRKSSTLKIILKSATKFFRNYFLKLGFLDGYYGYIICKMSAFSTFLKYAKIKELQKKERL
ncbi:glycosyl transferase [candidate division MSBL1 archaeon SCGC-AAA382M17]|uniref:Glycosyl transferase n=1 Tax=candidate division MSBL1 archaeon SCGC-AAA382M17 TaxID=1698284 RepID=A0ABR5TKV9_9EURY|nr:glycosyl transferase [candidate division MSBL1 archaeon SCGC-AAA382M17]